MLFSVGQDYWKSDVSTCFREWSRFKIVPKIQKKKLEKIVLPVIYVTFLQPYYHQNPSLFSYCTLMTENLNNVHL